MSGNPYGLSQISHYGSMQRVGGKAAGFINKKFFHPSSLRNQEKLWLALTAHERETRKQEEMEKRRVEEMQVEELRKQMYLQGQATQSTDALAYKPSASSSGQRLNKDQKLAIDEQQRRKALLKQERAAREELENAEEVDDVCELVESTTQRPSSEVDLASLAQSGYREDVHVRGHVSVWGSWYALEDRRWGYVCCKSLDRQKRCPLAPEEEEEVTDTKAKGEPRLRGKRRRKGGATNADDSAQLAATGSGTTNADDTAQLSASGSSALATSTEEVAGGEADQLLEGGEADQLLEGDDA